MTTFTGNVYYASERAQANRLYKEGRPATVSSYRSVRFVADDFVQIDLDASGTSYIHLALTK